MRGHAPPCRLLVDIFLCGAGSHPGPGVSMAPDRNAAQAIYSDLKLDFLATVTVR